MLKQTSPETSSVAAAEMRVESVWEGGRSCGEREKASQLFTVAMVDYLKELAAINLPPNGYYLGFLLD
jgi:hypothetical protein